MRNVKALAVGAFGIASLYGVLWTVGYLARPLFPGSVFWGTPLALLGFLTLAGGLICAVALWFVGSLTLDEIERQEKPKEPQ